MFLGLIAFPDPLARLRKNKSYTQKELAHRVGLNQAQIRRYQKKHLRAA